MNANGYELWSFDDFPERLHYALDRAAATGRDVHWTLNITPDKRCQGRPCLLDRHEVSNEITGPACRRLAGKERPSHRGDEATRSLEWTE
jgi:hypothetical protein